MSTSIGPNRSIALLEVSETDELVLNSLLELIGDRLPVSWQVERGVKSADCIIIDVDSPSGLKVWERNRAAAHTRIALTSGEAPADAQKIITKPIRVRDLLKYLSVSQLNRSTHDPVYVNSAGSADKATNASNANAQKARRSAAEPRSDAEAPTLHPQSVVRLRRWPNSELLKGRPELIRLCALLSARPLSIGTAVRVSRSAEESALSFLSDCASHGWLACEEP